MLFGGATAEFTGIPFNAQKYNISICSLADQSCTFIAEAELSNRETVKYVLNIGDYEYGDYYARFIGFMNNKTIERRSENFTKGKI